MSEDTRIGVDLAKNVFEIAISHRPGRIHQRHRLSRTEFLGFFVSLPAATVIMEACGSAHHWGREIERLGHKVILLPPRHVRPYVIGNKTDRADAAGLLEAERNAGIRPVPLKSIEQQTLASLHRLRAAWVAERTAKINTLRGLLRELGLVIPAGALKVVPAVRDFIDDPNSALPEVLRVSFTEVCEEIRALEGRIQRVEKQLEALARQLPAVARLRSIPGVGLLTATAVVASVGDPRRFPSARHFASYLGLTPREYSSGFRHRLGSITKRGDPYVRMLLIHGARTTLWHAKRLEHPDRLRLWALELERSSGHNKAAVALANKMARVIWATWTRDKDFASVPVAA